MNRPVPPQLSLPAYIAWLPPLIRFLATALQYQQDSEAYMDWCAGEVDKLKEQVKDLVAILEHPPHINDRPTVMLHPRTAEWIGSVWNQIKATTGTKIDRHTLDGAYWALSRTDFEKVLAYSWKEKKMWQSELFDCDDFALAFKSHFSEDWYPNGCNTVGFLVDNSPFSHHAYNLVVFEDGTWTIIEPGGDGDPNTGITWVDVTARLGQPPYEFREGYLLL